MNIDLLMSAIDAAIEKIGNPNLTPWGQVQAELRAVRAMNIHEAHAHKVNALIADFINKEIDLLRNADFAGMRRELLTFDTAIQRGGFTQAPVEKSQRELWALRANDCGWSNRQYNLLIQHLDAAGGERITAMNEESAATSKRTWTRRQLLLTCKPPTETTPDQIWLERQGFVEHHTEKRLIFSDGRPELRY